MSTLSEEIRAYREPETGAVSLFLNPPNKSTDNNPLFSAHYIALLPKEERATEREWFLEMARAYEAPGDPGRFLRYPGFHGYDSHDNLRAWLAGSWYLGITEVPKRILGHAIEEDWSWNNETPGKWTWRNWLARIVNVPTLVRITNGLKVGEFNQILVALCYLENCFENPKETGGRCMLILERPIYESINSKWINAAIGIWEIVMRKYFPGGAREVYARYFHRDEHPFQRHVTTGWRLEGGRR